MQLRKKWTKPPPTFTYCACGQNICLNNRPKTNVVIATPAVSVKPQLKMDSSIFRTVVVIFVSIISFVNCQSRVKVVRPKTVEVDPRFNWSNIAENHSFPSEPLRIFEFVQLPVYQNERQPICDGNVNIFYNHF